MYIQGTAVPHMFKVELYTIIHVLSKNSSFRENVIVTTSNFAPNHVIPCGNIMLAYSINFSIISIPNAISYNLYFTDRHHISYSCASVIRVTMVSMHDMLQDLIHNCI